MLNPFGHTGLGSDLFGTREGQPFSLKERQQLRVITWGESRSPFFAGHPAPPHPFFRGKVVLVSSERIVNSSHPTRLGTQSSAVTDSDRREASKSEAWRRMSLLMDLTYSG